MDLRELEKDKGAVSWLYNIKYCYKYINSKVSRIIYQLSVINFVFYYIYKINYFKFKPLNKQKKILPKVKTVYIQ